MSPSRDRILAAAADLYDRHGFQGATTRRIAAAAGVNEVTLFRLFGSKRKLLAAALLRSAELARVPELTRSGSPAAQELSAWSGQLLTVLRLRLAARGAPELTGVAAESPAIAVIEQARAHLAAYLDALALPPHGSAAKHAAIEALLGSLALRAIAPATPAAEDEHAVHALVTFALEALSAPVRSPDARRAVPPPYEPDATGA